MLKGFLLPKNKNKLEKNYSQTVDEKHSIIIEKFTKKFKKFYAVNNIDLQVEKGTIHGFIGPNGSGKTTTIKCLVSAMMPSKGRLLIHNEDSWKVSAKKHVGYIPEAARFPKKISAEDYLVSMGQISGLTYKEAKIKTEEILKELDLWKFKKRSPNNYSSGMKKKVLLAQSLLNNPDILILDEPAANLDPTARTELFNDLKKLKNEGKTIFISSHILSELQNLADYVTILNYSKIVYSGAVNLSENKYELQTDDNLKTKILLQENNFILNEEEKSLIININDEKDKNKILKLVLKEKINIELFKPHILDLQTMYEKIVIENNPNMKTKRKGK